METLLNSCQTENNKDFDSANKILEQQNCSQCETSFLPLTFSSEETFPRCLITNERQHLSNQFLDFWSSKISVNAKEICKITGIVIKIIVLSLLINTIVTSSFGTPRNDERNGTSSKLSSLTWEETTTVSLITRLTNKFIRM